MYLRKLCHSSGLGQLMGVVCKRMRTPAIGQQEEGCMLVACIETGTTIAVQSEIYF